MAGPYKVTMLFNFQGSGFSETWYYNVTGTLTQTNLDQIDAMAQVRNALTAEFVNLVAYRVSDLANPRATYVKNYASFPVSANLPDVPSTAWLAIARGPNGQGRRQFWMRGIADSWVQWDDTTESWKLVGTFNTKFQAFVAVITQTPWTIRVVTSTRGGAPSFPITSIASGTQQGQAIMTITNGPASTDAPIVIGGFRKPLAFLNGTYIYPTGFNVGGSTIVLRTKTITPQQAGAYITGGVARTQQFSYVTPATVQLVSPRERRVGRAFFVPRGRRSASR